MTARNSPKERLRIRAAVGPVMRRAALLALLPVLVVAAEPNVGRAAPPVPGSLHAFSAAAREAVLDELSSEVDGPAWLDSQQYHRAPLRRVHRVTAYCDIGLTAAGVPSGVGQCAAPADIPFGSIVYLPELDQSFVVTDRTAERFRHNTVDIFIPDRDDCLQFGLNYLECEIYIPRTPPRYGSPAIQEAILAFAS